MGLARLITLSPAVLFIGATLVLPMLLMLTYSLWRFVPGKITDHTWTIQNYVRLLGDPFYLDVIGRTVAMGLIVTVSSLAVGYPLAYFLAHTRSRVRGALVYLIFVPIMIGIVVKAYGWIVLLGHNGAFNNIAISLGLIERPVRLLYTSSAVVFGLTHVLLPFMVMPVLSALEKIPPQVEEAARSLGATPAQNFYKVVLPLSLPGIVSGSLMVFSLSITAYALPALLGGPRVKLVSALAYDSMLVSYNWPFASAIGITMIVVATAAIYVYLRLMNPRVAS